MWISNLFDVEPCKDYCRIKLSIAYDDDDEDNAVAKKVLEYNKVDMDYKTTEVSLVAYLRYWYDSKQITVDESDLISAYVEDVGELRFLNEWISDKAVSRCKAWVRLLVDMNGIEKVEKEWISPYGRDLEYPPTYPPEERVK